MPTPAPLPPPLSEAELTQFDHLIAMMGNGEGTMSIHAISRLMKEIRRLRAALAGWKCETCKGSGRSAHVSVEDKWHGIAVACPACAGSGLHPAARAALGDAGAGGGAGTGGER